MKFDKGNLVDRAVLRAATRDTVEKIFRGHKLIDALVSKYYPNWTIDALATEALEWFLEKDSEFERIALATDGEPLPDGATESMAIGFRDGIEALLREHIAKLN